MMKRPNLLKKHRELILAYFETYPPNNYQTAVRQIEGLVAHSYSRDHIRRFLKNEGVVCQQILKDSQRKHEKDQLGQQEKTTTQGTLLKDLLPHAVKELSIVTLTTIGKIILEEENRFERKMNLLRYFTIGFILAQRQFSPLVATLISSTIQTLRPQLIPIIADLIHPFLTHYGLLETVPLPYFRSFYEYGYAAERDCTVKLEDHISSADEELLQHWISRHPRASHINMLRTAFASNTLLAAFSDATILAFSLPLAVKLALQLHQAAENDPSSTKEMNSPIETERASSPSTKNSSEDNFDNSTNSDNEE
jgi:hypothetical protein